MPRIRWTARVVGIGIVLWMAAGDARSQAPRTKAAPRGAPAGGALPGDKPAAVPDDAAPELDPAKPRGAAGPAAPGAGGTPEPAPAPGGRNRGGPGGGPGRNGSGLDRLRATLLNPSAPVAATLLPLPPVQKELKLTEKQKAGVLKLTQAMAQQTRVIRQQQRGMFQAARMAGMMPDFSGLQAQETVLQQENEAAFAALLTKAEQRRRLNQIATQILGPLAVARPDVAEKLNLSEDQQTDIQAIMMERQAGLDQLNTERRMAAFAGRDPNADPASRDLGSSKARSLDQKTQTLQDDTRKRIGRILSRKQKADFLKLLGEPFDIAALEGTGPGGPGGFGGGPGRFGGGPGAGGGPPPAENGAMPKGAAADPDTAEAAPPKSDRSRGPGRKAPKPAADPGE